MISEKFDRLFTRLVDVFKRYHEAPRSPAQVAELGAARWDLELARKAIAEERQRVIAYYEPLPPIPRQVAMSDDELARLRVAGLGVLTS
jgi:hypothetical protein